MVINIMFDFKEEIQHENTTCPMCGESVNQGESLIFDEYRNETLCANCLEAYKKEIISEEGADGRLLK